MNFKHNLLVGLASASLFFGCSSPQEKTVEIEVTKPIIVIIYMDDLGYGDLSAYGATALSAPNMDSLA